MKKDIIGYTTGVFDLFHVGHLNILKRAAECCDILVVGVTDCDVVESYKGYRPIVPLDERMAIIQELKCVNKVVVQSSMDKIAAWNDIQYDKLFHGDDWKGSEMYNSTEKQLLELGVEIIYFPYSQGISTSDLKQRVYEQFS